MATAVTKKLLLSGSAKLGWQASPEARFGRYVSLFCQIPICPAVTYKVTERIGKQLKEAQSLSLQANLWLRSVCCPVANTSNLREFVEREKVSITTLQKFRRLDERIERSITPEPFSPRGLVSPLALQRHVSVEFEMEFADAWIQKKRV